MFFEATLHARLFEGFQFCQQTAHALHRDALIIGALGPLALVRESNLTGRVKRERDRVRARGSKRGRDRTSVRER